MSEFWQRKMRTKFRRLDFDKDGVISKRDLELMAEGFCASEKVDPVKKEKMRKLLVDFWLKFMSSSKTDEKGLLTEDVLIDSLKEHKNDPKLKASFEKLCRNFFGAMDTNEDGYLQPTEFRRAYDSFGLADTSFAEEAFKDIDTNHVGKLSIDELTHALLEFMLCEDEESPCNLMWGPLI